jgi:hypothetical protein
MEMEIAINFSWGSWGRNNNEKRKKEKNIHT